ncbi:hypothetical protein AB0E67_11320 [Streptomyces sp. NPDC032161]|uniref:class I SAM-dependent methyltransferase n=1 Tax=Streptomyces sp. NPDC032161 TaxID=3155253 RepID=UPI0033CE562E
MDSYTHRPQPADRVRNFEADTPATQEWQRALPAGTGTKVPPPARFVPVGFEQMDALLREHRLQPVECVHRRDAVALGAAVT